MVNNRFNKTEKRKLKTNKKNKRKIKSRRIRRKMYGGTIPNFTTPLKPETQALLSGVSFLNSEDTRLPLVLENPEILTNVRKYQEKSLYINKFLREGFDYIALDMNIKDLIDDVEIERLLIPLDENDNTEEEHEAYDQLFTEDLSNIESIDTEVIETALELVFHNFSANIMNITMNIDRAFIDANSTVFSNRTVLYRGTDTTYPQDNMSSFISTSKTLDSVFAATFINKSGKFLNNTTKCCVNMLIVESGIPYLDMEFIEEHWTNQKEVLLPRGLKMTLIDETYYDYQDQRVHPINHGPYKVYVYHVTTQDLEMYHLPEPEPRYDIRQVEFYDYKSMNFLFSKRFVKILENIYSFFSSMDYDFIENIKYKISDYSTRAFRYKCPRMSYIELSKYILEKLRDIINTEIRNNNIKPHCRDRVNGILAMIDSNLSSPDNIEITKDNFIIKAC